MKIVNPLMAFCITGMCFLAVMVFSRESPAIEDPMLERWSEFSRKPGCIKLVGWLRCQARSRMTGTPCEDALRIATPPFFGRLGIFITLKKGKKVRGCYGAFSHGSADIESLLSDYLAGALTRDPRYKPLDVSELPDTDIILTITAPPYAVNDYTSIDTHRCGIVLICGGDTIIFVPAEIINNSYLDKIMNGRTCQVSAFKTVTIR